MKFSFIFAWFDFWIGMYFDRDRNWLYVLPFPMIGMVLKFPQRRYWLVSNYSGEIIGSTPKSDLVYAMTQDNVHGRAYWAVNGSTKPLFGRDYNEDDEPPHNVICCPS